MLEGRYRAARALREGSRQKKLQVFSWRWHLGTVPGGTHAGLCVPAEQMATGWKTGQNEQERFIKT